MARPALSTSTIATVPIANMDDLTQVFADFHEYQVLVAREELEDEQAKGNLVDPVTYVDGKKSDNIAGVKLFGTIRYVSGVGPTQKAIAMAAAYVAQKSPYRTGHYAESMVWALNGRVIGDPPNAEQVGPKGNAMLINLTPYASWLEVQLPNGVIFGAYMALKRAFGATLSIAYGYANPKSFGGQAWAPGSKPGEHPYMVPYLLIGNPGSSVNPGSTSRPTSKSGKRRANDKRAGRGHRQRRGIGRGQGPKT